MFCLHFYLYNSQKFHPYYDAVSSVGINKISLLPQNCDLINENRDASVRIKVTCPVYFGTIIYGMYMGNLK